MILKLSAKSPLLCLVLVVLLSACGNKGDLFLVPDEVTQQELIRIEQALETQANTSNELDTREEDEDESKKDKAENTLSN